PEAIAAFLEGHAFEDVIRTAVSLGGDCDTLTCIAGSICLNTARYCLLSRLRSTARFLKKAGRAKTF
ncbi:MAG: ADP-ribosylglycohydrolase family protein, partial [Alistipes sp.]|nr:ADP-ribosylglycohydrolase family protein [Alistipes sp.]